MTTRPGPPRQKRSQAAMERILEAAQQLITDEGVAGFTLGTVAARAGVAVGTVYQRFANKEDLLVSTQRRWLDEVARAQRELFLPAAVRQPDFVRAVCLYAEHLVALFRDHAALVREFVVYATAVPALRESAQQRLDQLARERCDALMAHPGRPPHITRGHLLLALRAVQSLLEWRVAASPDTEEAAAMPWETLADDIPKLVTAYLGHDA
ncbi:TetR/AcrR family transcriptional regulator [Kitasatospora sp. NPDC057512]|uniref:TetR/AcrR family transcriptional regulator n=1 Tax=Kitasatospora sp. NPDC057512 TaxID=3346154 RepID=UPI00367BF65D